MKHRDIYLGSALLIAFSCLIQYLWFSQGFYSISWDDAGRTLDAWQWMAEGDTMTTSPWLPFYRVVVGLGLMINPDLIITPRIITGAFGVAALLATVWLSDELFHDKQITLLTAILGSFLPARVVLSLAPLSSIMFTTFVVLGLAYFARWCASRFTRDLILASLFFAVSGTVRYEGWIFSGVFFGTVVVLRYLKRYQMHWRDAFIVLGILSCFPVVVMANYWAEMSNPFAFVGGTLPGYEDFTTVWLKNPLVEFFRFNAASLNITGLIAAIYLAGTDARLRPVIVIPGLALMLISIVLLLGHSAQTGPAWRMTGVWSMILLPFSAHLITKFARFSQNGLPRRLLWGALVSLFIGDFVLHTHRIKASSVWAFPLGDRELGHYLEDMVAGGGAKVLIESSRYFYLNVLVASQHPDAFVLNSVPEKPYARESILDPETPVNLAQLEPSEISLLVFKSPRFLNWLDRATAVDRIREFPGWTIYRIDRRP